MVADFTLAFTCRELSPCGSWWGLVCVREEWLSHTDPGCPENHREEFGLYTHWVAMMSVYEDFILSPLLLTNLMSSNLFKC